MIQKELFDMIAYSLALNDSLYNQSKELPRKKKKAIRKLCKQTEADWMNKADWLYEKTFGLKTT